jgi:LysM repeat protein
MVLAPRALAQTANCAQTYIVQQGDWLSSIAQKFLGDVKAYDAIQQATNDAAKTDSSFATIADANKIEVGQKLCIPERTGGTTLPPQGPGPVIPSAAGAYTHVGPAADASALVETFLLTDDFKATHLLDYIGKARITETGTWTTENFQYVVTLTNQDGKAINEQLKFQLDANGNLVSVGDAPITYAKTSPEVIQHAGLYTANRSSADGKEKLIALALLPNGVAQLTSSSDANPFILKTGTWQLGTNPDTNAPSLTVMLDKQGDTAINETYVFQIDGDNLRGTQYNADKWGTDLTFTKFNAPSEPETPASASQ